MSLDIKHCIWYLYNLLNDFRTLLDFVVVRVNAMNNTGQTLDLDVDESTSKLVNWLLANWHVGETTVNPLEYFRLKSAEKYF